MSVTIDAFLVDWNELVSKYAQLGQDLNFWEATDEEEQWLETWDFDGSEISLTTAMAFSDLYKALRAKTAESEIKQIDQFLNAFTVTNKEEAFTPLQDLGPDTDEETVFGSMTPDSVRKYLAIFENLNVEVLRGPFEEYKRSTNEAILFDDFEQFLEYVNLWGNLLNAAGNKGRGLALFCG